MNQAVHSTGPAAANALARSKAPTTFGTVSLTRENSTITGYCMDDGSFQFIIGGKLGDYGTLQAAHSAWTENQNREILESVDGPQGV